MSRLDIGLATTLIDFNDLQVGVPDLFEAHVAGSIDAGAGQGKLDISLQQLQWQYDSAELVLQVDSDAPLPITYHMGRGGDSLDIAASRWSAAGLLIDIGSLTTPVDIGAITGTLEDVDVRIEPWLHASVSGSYHGDAPYAELAVTLLSLGEDSLSLAQPTARVDVATRQGHQLVR